MIERELYIKVLDCLHDEQCLAKKVQMIQERDFQVIGNVIINMLLEEIAEVDMTKEVISVIHQKAKSFRKIVEMINTLENIARVNGIKLIDENIIQEVFR